MRLIADNSWGRIVVLVLGVSLFSSLGVVPRSGGLWERLYGGVSPGVTVEGYGLGEGVENVGGWLPREVKAWIGDLGTQSFRPPVPARIRPPHGNIWWEVPGVAVDMDRTQRQMAEAGPGSSLRVRTTVMSPYVTRGALEGLTRQLGGFSTWGKGGGGRNYNLYLGAVLLDWTLLLPGEMFSFWERMGVPTSERGFEPAPVIVGDSVVMAPGGGLCQVSTTLYNAALRAGMEIVERHPHTMPVDYVGPGMDAAVAWGHLDLRFRNPGPWPVLVRTGYAGGLLWAEILGPEKTGATDG